MRWLINYIRSCFCKHDFELIFKGSTTVTKPGKVTKKYNIRKYRCKKCGYEMKHDSL